MELKIYPSDYNNIETIEAFMTYYYSSRMNYMASDLLEKGLSNEQISEAILKAISIANASGLESRQHFKPVYSAINHQIIKDCKLSNLGYGLVLLNADATVGIVGDFQINLLKKFFGDN